MPLSLTSDARAEIDRMGCDSKAQVTKLLGDFWLTSNSSILALNILF